jgi:hypothetical protein
MWQRFDAILQLEAGAYACQDLDTTRLVPKALIRLSPSTVQLGHPCRKWRTPSEKTKTHGEDNGRTGPSQFLENGAGDDPIKVFRNF